ncbi:TPA: hypothetical protein DCQ44_01495 [Candidatus Taylorbacteria bacterium]|nr:hypothetical protein [Candidatus Taylorbacteria bacterium]
MEKLGDLITLREASKISGYNFDYLGFLIRSGKLNGRKVGRNWMTTTVDVKYYLEHSVMLPKVTKKPVTFKVSVVIVFISVIATLGAFYAYSVIYQNAYDQATATNSKISKTVTSQLDQ